MFTGIVTAIGTIAKVEQRGDLHVTIACPLDPATIAIGASIACSGVCLTVVDRGGEAGAGWFTVDISAETVSRTAKGMWTEGRRINLEPSLRLGRSALQPRRWSDAVVDILLLQAGRGVESIELALDVQPQRSPL